jgi:tetracycline 7-halogenase / FADH2 O2-dependent halogenase
MSECSVDIVVIGSGFAGSLAAWLLARQGHAVALIEHGKHPRFAIGESSTPLADFKLRQIAQRHDLPELLAFTQYGTWKRSHPEITCGVKRGFAYFYHQPNQSFDAGENHANELLVTANSSTETSDTHWLRADIDSHFVARAIDHGVQYFDETSIDAFQPGEPHRLRGQRKGAALLINARFLIVATGSPKLWNDHFPIPSTGRMPRTNTRSVFAHFADLRPWREILLERGLSINEHPFPCDQSALHHVFDGGWMWQLGFDDGSTSVGFSIDCNRHPNAAPGNPHDHFYGWLNRFPDVKKQFATARIIRPKNGLQSVNRLQQPLRQITGDRWALLPAAVGFADPLFSTGIAHALFSVEQLTRVIQDLGHPERLKEQLQRYDQRVNRELDLMDRLVSLAYRSTGNFAKFVTSTMSYFAAATVCERSSMEVTGNETPPAFLLAENNEFLAAIDCIERAFSGTSERDFEDIASAALGRFNHVGLFKPEVPRMYRYTAAPK